MSEKTKPLPKKGTMERAQLDAFYGGYCCALSAALNGDDGTSTEYVEAVVACGMEGLLAYAIREDEMELPNIRRAVKSHRDHLERCARSERAKRNADKPIGAQPDERDATP
jgi:hypothetical protein